MRPQDLEHQTRRQLSRLDERNRPVVEVFLREKRLAGLKPSSLLNYASALASLDDSLHGEPIWTASAADLMAHQERALQRLSARTVEQSTTLLRCFLKWKLDVEQLPSTIRRALRAPASQAKEPEPVNEQEFHHLLNHASRSPMMQALLWVLWEAGLRNGELRALNVGSLTLDHRGGGELRLPAGADGLKTGTRSVPVIHCLPTLRAWVSLHPRATEATAPLFVTSRRHGSNPQGRLRHDSVNKWLRRACRDLALRPIHPHLFRHAMGTRMNRNNWSEVKQCQFAGWSRFSKMPRYYAHLDRSELIEQVRRDAGIDDHGLPIQSATVDDAALEAKLRRALKRLLLDEMP